MNIEKSLKSTSSTKPKQVPSSTKCFGRCWEKKENQKDYIAANLLCLLFNNTVPLGSLKNKTSKKKSTSKKD